MEPKVYLAKVQDGASKLAELAHPRHDAMIQILHAAKVGMGSIEYELVEV